ncbi:MAG: PAS domain S-box protein [Rhodospirillales bacterium]
MSIQTKIIAVLVVVLGGLLLGDLIVLDRVVLEGFRKLENQETRREIGRTMAIVDDEVKSLDPVASNWAQSEGLAGFAQTGDPAFAEQHLTNAILDTLVLDMVIVVDRQGRVVFTRIRNRETGGTIRAHNLEHDDFPEDHPLLAHNRGVGHIRGTVATDNGPMLVTAAPLLGKLGAPPAAGTVIIGRLMDKAAVSRISGQMNNALEMTPITQGLSTGQRATVNHILALDEPVIERAADGSWSAALVQRDLFGYPAALYSITAWSTIHGLGADTVRTAGVMAVLASLIVICVIVFLMRRLIVQPFAKLKRELLDIRASGDLTNMLPARGNDEFALVSREINDLLTERAEFEQALERHQSELERRVEERTYELQREIADKEAAQETLKFTEFSLSHSGEALFWLRRDQRILYVNDATCRHLGYTQKELLGMSFPDFSDGPPPDKDWDTFWEELKRGGQIRFDTRHRRKDGSAVPVEVRATVMEYAGEEFLFAFAQDISRRLAREQALIESERRFRTLTEEANQGIVVHRGFYPLYVNPAFLRIFGFESHNEFLQQGSLEVTLAPEEVARIRGYDLARMQGQNAPSDYIYRGIRKDGTEVWLNNRSFLIDWGDGPAVCTVLFDVTKNRNAMQQLYLLESAMQDANDPFFAVNAEGRFIYVNDASCRALGYSRDELLNMDVSMINPARTGNNWQERWEHLKVHGHRVSFGEHHRKDGTTFPVETTSTFIDHDGQEYIFAYSRDISERLRTENALRQARDDLEKRVEERTQELTREVEERRRAELAVQQSEARLRGALESLQEGFALFDADDRLVLMNSRYADTHPNAEDLLAQGGTFEEVVRASMPRIANTQGREEEFLANRMNEHRNPGPPIIREFTDGRWFLLRENRTTDGGITVTATDITELKTIEADLKQKTELFDTAVRAMNNGIVVLDSDLRFVTYNDHYINLFDFPPGLVQEGARLENALRFLAERGDYGDQDTPDEIVERHIADIRRQGNLIIRRHLTNGRTVETRRGWLPDGGMVGIHVDITENVQFEERLREARDTAESANKAKSIFLANMSHEIRTPMNGIMGVAEMLHDTALSSTQRGMLTIIQDSCRTLMSIIDDILDFSKIEAGRLELDLSPFRLSDLVEGVADLLAPRAEERRNRLGVFIDPTIPDELIGDPTRLRQILLNLVGNAVKFTDNGRIDIDVRAETAEDGGSWFMFRVHDTGIGISEENKRKLFQPFEQGDSSTMRRFGGTGLGLSICRALVDMLGGEIGADSRKGRGATFWFRISMLPSRNPTAAIGRPFAGRRVGILAGDTGTAERIDIYLRHLGAETDIIPSLRALTRLTSAGKTLDGQFDLLILDHDRGGDGVSRFIAAREKAEDPITPRTVILMPRSDIMSIDPDRLAGQYMFVPKPVQRAMIWNAAAMALDINLPGIDAPVRRAADTAALPLYATPDTETARAEGALVLFAEDNPVNCKVICMMLERLGIAVETAVNGVDAWNRIRRQSYGMLITDCHMPEMDGYELAEKVRTLERTGDRPRVPIIALTADALIGTKERCRTAGMDDYLPKPVDRATLNELIQRWLPKAVQLRRPLTAGDHGTPRNEIFGDDAILDLRYIHDAVGGDETMVAPLLEDYIRNARRLVDDMLDAFADADFTRAREAAHAAKGTSRLAGAVRFANLCEQIELFLCAGDTSRAAEYSRRIEPELAVVSQAVAGHDRRSIS